MGRATFIDSAAITDKVRADLVGRGMTTINDELPFEFRIESVMHAKYPGGHGTWPPKYRYGNRAERFRAWRWRRSTGDRSARLLPSLEGRAGG